MLDTAIQQSDKFIPDKRTNTGKPIDLKKVLDLKYNKKLSYQEIGDTLGYSKQYIGRVIKHFKSLSLNPDITETYQNNRVHLLNNVELNLLTKFGDEDKLKKATLGNVAYALQNISNLRRLESNQSTQNIGISIQAKLSKALNQSSRPDESTNIDEDN